MLGPYEILSQIGAGGMGEVYKGRDTRLDRPVAIKILPTHLAERPDLRKRFEREATTVANLQHPNICVLYDVGKQVPVPPDSAGKAAEIEGAGEQRPVDFLVMEYLEGVTLSERLKKGPLALDEVLRYAVEVSDALDKAHRAGVTHRDVKPANVMLTREGSKLLDFGLAKLKLDILDATVPPSERPTVPGALTQHGTLLGTLQYMAPEQLECKDEKIDGRTDIFAFGTVVYEIVTGKKAFPGESQASVIAGILERQPVPMTSLQPPGTIVPPALDRTVRRCLAKDPEDRWQTARDLVQELRWIADVTSHPELTGSTPAPPPVPARASRRQLVLGSLAALVLAALVGLAAWILKPAPAQPVSRFTITLPPGQKLAVSNGSGLALSPDGSRLVYAAIGDGTQQLYLRALDSLETQPIPGTEGAETPFFSPDGQWIGFFGNTRLKKVSVSGGVPVDIGGVAVPRGASWSGRGTIVWGALGFLTLQQVPAAGGTQQALTRLENGEAAHYWPEVLPDGETVLFASTLDLNDWNAAQIAAHSIRTGERRNLNQGGTHPRYAPTGHLVYAQGGALMAAPFDPQRLALTGATAPVQDSVLQSTSTGFAHYSFSATGTLAYVPGGIQAARSSLVWVSRSGAEQPLVGPERAYYMPRLSPDGQRVAVVIGEQGNQIWLYDLSRETLTRLTFEGGNQLPVWTPDGKKIAFRSSRAGGPPNLFWQLADGSGELERLTTSENINGSFSWSPDGQFLAFLEIRPTTGRDIEVLRMSDRKAQPFLQTPFDETAPQFSPDGHWLAYMSNESGRYEVYVQPYPGPGGKWQISTDGGTEPVWNRNGREIFYRNGNKMMAVEVSTQPGFTMGRPRMLFEGSYLPPPFPVANYDVSPDGQRFLMVKPSGEGQPSTQINVVLNWFEELKRRVPTR
jgi:serine/threonine-protein kinase